MIIDYELCKGKKVLVVDDEIPILKLISYNLDQISFSVTAVESGEQALALIKKNDFHVMILDLFLPKISGYDVCKTIRASGNNMPIMLLTGQASHDSLIKGFDCGADDYMAKPFLLSEMTARLRSLVKRAYGKSNKSVIRVGDLTMDVASMRIEVNGFHVRLSAREFKLLKVFMECPEIVFSREELLRVWPGNKDVDIRTIDVHINRLRNALVKGQKEGRGTGSHCCQYIRTIRGSGYSLIVDNKEHSPSSEKIAG